MPSAAGDHEPFPPLQRLIGALDEVAALPSVDSPKQLARARIALGALLRQPRWLDRYCRGPSPLPVHNGFLAVHVAPAFTIYAGMFPPKHKTGIHDHRTWGLVGTWAGEEIDQRFRIVERDLDHRVRLEPTRVSVNTARVISVLIPNVDEIHMVGNVRGRPAFSIHIYGYGSERKVGPSTWYGTPDADGWARVLPPLGSP